MNNELPGTGAKITHWQEASLMGNPYRRTLHPMMLSEKGYEIVVYSKVRKKDERTQERIRYDRTYIAEKFVREFLVPLGIRDFRMFGYLLGGQIHEASILHEFDPVTAEFIERIWLEECEREAAENVSF